jgi:GMP synthase (glutamine-hydrolysing)
VSRDASSGRILVVKTGSTVPSVRRRRGDFEDWIAAGLGCAISDLCVVPVHEGGTLPEDPTEAAGVVVTGSPALVSEREPWSVRAGAWLAAATLAEVPVLGICYGHQLLAQALGGRVGANPRGRSIGTVTVEFSSAAVDDPLLGRLAGPGAGPLGGKGRFHVTHLESVLELPAGAELLAASPTDPHHAFRMGARAWGVQFHPEFDADVLRGYVAERAEDLRREQIAPEEVESGIVETPAGPALLRRFAGIVLG